MGRFLLFVLLLVCATAITAQQGFTGDTPFVLKHHIPPQGIQLNKGWKFQPGDNPAFAEPAFDDSQWQSIDPTKDIHDLPQLWKGIGWFRIKIHIDSTVHIQPLALILQQSGASEIYMNGKLLKRFGTVSTEPEKIVTYDPWGKPLPLQFIKGGTNVIAIRYALQPHLFYSRITIRQNPAFYLTLNYMEAAVDLYGRSSERIGGAMLSIGFFLLLLILHLAFYLYYPAQKANLYFSIYAALNFISYFIENNSINEVKYIFYQFNTLATLGQVGNFFLLTALYILLNQKRGWVYWNLLTLIILGVVLNATVYLYGFIISAFFINTLVNLETVRIAFITVKKGQQGAWIIATGTIAFFVFWCTFLYLALSGKMFIPLGEVYIVGDLLYIMALFSIPVSTSIYLALDFAFTSHHLQQKLIEVQNLSQEKQQILALQKETLEQQVTERTAALNQSLTELKATQAQLVQREKMASLGELTAGIAHEIQNPLNFVNNFSEINTELIDELKQEAQTGNTTGVIQLADELKENEQKIAHHGKRADAIVRGMLQHSRKSTGEKEPTEINALVDEYLKLSYHGLRAKEKDFTASLETDFDQTVGQVNLVPQDLGRVLLNLFNNAFYATLEKKRRLNGTYEPVINVYTKRSTDRVEIQIKDNGMGISKSVQSKIFQPFFTTKPSGEGTGLGLSLSYDIVTKGHGGELTVQSVEGEGATFMVRLPV